MIDQLSALLDYAMTLPWYVSTVGGLILTHLAYNVCSTLWKVGKTTYKVGRGVTLTAYSIVSFPYRVANKVYHRFVPEPVNDRYSGNLSVQDLIDLNNRMYKHGTADISDELLIKYVQTAERIKDSKGKAMRLIALPELYANQKETPPREITRAIAELSARNHPMVAELIGANPIKG